jgi:TolB-like protein
MAEERVQRRLAAILAADVVGYSRLIEQDEVGTLAVLRQRRKDILKPLVAEHQGRIVKVMGDGVLVEFASAVNAVACAVELQKRMASANDGLPEERRIVLRIGINLGDLVVEGGDLYGDGVNLAARLQAMAEPSGIYVSQTVRDHVKNKVELKFEDLGEQTIRNIAEPMRVYRIAGAGLVGKSATRELPLPSKPSIAVLPFENLSGDAEQEYFSDGVTEDIITELSRFRELFVIARNSSFQYRGKQVDLRRIGRELGVQFVVEGSIRVLGTRVRVTAQLIDAMSGNHIWAERYDRNMQDIFALQDELANGVAASVGARVEAAGRARTVRLSSNALKAYDLILRAKASWMQMSRSSNEERRTFLQRAIEVDPTHAQAHAYCAHTHFLDYMAGWVADPDRSLRADPRSC